MKDFRPCLRSLRQTFRPVKWKVSVNILIGLLLVALSLIFVWMSKRVIDIATGAVVMPLKPSVIMLGIVMFLQVLMKVLAKYWEGFVDVQACNDLRRSVFEKVMRSCWTGREKFHSGDTVNRLETDINVVADFLCITLPSSAVTFVRLISASVFFFILEPHLAWILVFVMPVAVIGSRLFFRRLRQITNEIRALDSLVQGHMQESLQHRVVVMTMGGTPRILSRLETLQLRLYRKNKKRLKYGSIARAFMSLGFAGGYALAFIWGVYGIKNGNLGYGTMVAFLQLVSQIQNPVAELAQNIPAFIRALSSEERLMELDELDQESANGDIHFDGAPGILVENLSFRYEGKSYPVLRDLSYDFKPGSTTVILGPTGAGKSTFIRIILSLLKQQSGSVKLYGRKIDSSVDIVQETNPDTRCNFMYVPQGNSLMSGTIEENLMLAKQDATEDEMREALHMAAADFVFDNPDGLTMSCAEVGAGLSEGQAQRVAIARALLRPGGVLVLDEATSALDAETEALLLERLSKCYKGKKTILCITHRPAASKYADGVLTIEDIK